MASTSPIAESEIDLVVNGRIFQLQVRHHWTLLDVLREELDLTGAKKGCDRGECGSCTVLLEGAPVYSCQLLVMQMAGRRVRTIEGLASNGVLDPVQQSFLDHDGGQCGYCTPGFVLAAKSLLETNPNPADDEIRRELSGNLCRCNAYARIIESVRALVLEPVQSEA